MRKILFATLLFCLSIATNAQDITTTKKTKHKVGLGVQASVLSATANAGNDTYSNYSAKLGFRAGVTLNMPLGKKIAFTPSLNYVNKGTKEIFTSRFIIDYPPKYDLTVATSHIEIPLNFTFTTGNAKGFIASLGPIISYGIGGEVTGTETDYDFVGHSSTAPVNASVKFDGSSTNYYYPYYTHFKAVEVGGNIMLGYKFSPKYSLSAIYNTSFTNSAPNRDGYTNTYKTSYWGLNFGYSFF